MKTPDEIKKGLECCSQLCGCLEGCPYEADGTCDSERECVEKDALALIQQLEETISEMEKVDEKLAWENGTLIAKVPKWISVEERLPDKNGKYLVHAHHWVEGVKPIIRCCLWLNGKWDKYDAYTVDHWMPLPEPPKEE